MQNMQPVTMETDMYHSGCLTHTHWQTQLSLTYTIAKIKVETTLGANGGCIEQRARQVERQMDRCTG